MHHLSRKLIGVASAAGLALALSAGSGFASTQVAGNAASSSAANGSATIQHANQNQQAANSSGGVGGLFSTGGGGNIGPQDQTLGQFAATSQFAASVANANSHALNANVPVTINGFGVISGIDSGGANQVASNSADSHASNTSTTDQNANQNQQAANSSGSSGAGLFGAGGGGNISPQSQDLNQTATTTQDALSAAQADQQLVNANVPVAINGFGTIGTGFGPLGGSSNQVGLNQANSSADNAASTFQAAGQNQTSASNSGSGFGGLFGTGGGGSLNPEHQGLAQAAATNQALASLGQATQALTSAASPHTIG
jgi:hypothetical protein